MATSDFQHFTTFFLLTIFLALTSRSTQSNLDQSTGLKKLMENTLEWPIPMSTYNADEEYEEQNGHDFEDGLEYIMDVKNTKEEEEEEENDRRSLFWRRFHYYISYGALAADRIPCPPRSGRSYYTHNCYKTRVPVNPYNRGCSRITRCRR